jgi:penicillin V acylase-like amidase (Ntn superfamily)
MRIPEAYYIAAECYLKQTTPDVASALNLLNTVRQKRGITTNLTGLTTTTAMNEIVKEYTKEFYCEGAMFFLYKRLGMETIPNYTQTATDAIYVLPYPSTELQMGRKQ